MQGVPLLEQEGNPLPCNSFTPSGWSLTQNVSPDCPPLLPQEGNTFAWTHFHNFGCRVMSLCFRDAPLEHEADGPLICMRSHEVGTAESGHEVVQRDLVPHVGNGEPESNAPAVAAPEEIVRAAPNIEQVTRRNARGIVIVIGGARSRYLQTGRSKVGSTARADRTVWCCHRAAAEEANRGLLRGCQCEKVVKSRHGARHQAAIVPPGKAGPGTILLPLIPNVRRLLEGLIVIDTENRRIYRRVEQQASHFGTKEARPVVSHGGVPPTSKPSSGTPPWDTTGLAS